MEDVVLGRTLKDGLQRRPAIANEGLFRGPPAAHGYDTPEVRKMEEAKVGNTGMIQAEGGRRLRSSRGRLKLES